MYTLAVVWYLMSVALQVKHGQLTNNVWPERPTNVCQFANYICSGSTPSKDLMYEPDRIGYHGEEGLIDSIVKFAHTGLRFLLETHFPACSDAGLKKQKLGEDCGTFSPLLVYCGTVWLRTRSRLLYRYRSRFSVSRDCCTDDGGAQAAPYLFLERKRTAL